MRDIFAVLYAVQFKFHIKTTVNPDTHRATMVSGRTSESLTFYPPSCSFDRGGGAIDGCHLLSDAGFWFGFSAEEAGEVVLGGKAKHWTSLLDFPSINLGIFNTAS